MTPNFGRRKRRDTQGRILPPTVSMHTLVVRLGVFVALIVVFLVIGKIYMPTRIRLDAATTASTLFADPKDIPERLLLQLDAVFILGGGRPASWDQPPVYVKQRCDDAASVVLRRKAVLFRMYNKSNDAKNENNLPDISPSRQTEAQKRNIRDLPILCLSAGTPHLPQLMDAKHGLPIWEATASASYLALNHNMTRNVFVETASYDTIGNAFYARATHTDIVHWNKLLIVTNEFHMARTRAIFDWIFGLDPQGSERYKLFYLQSSTVGMSDEALLARQSMEAESETKVHELATTYRSMDQVWWFLNSKHDLYSAGGLIERANDVQPGLQELESDLIRKGYGGTR